ncbi:MAG: squalene/phytoene synthase family protein, partial [Telluria sp.]
ILNARHSDKFEALMKFQADRARGYYDEAMALLPKEDRRAQRPGLMMAAIYHTMLDEIEHEHFHVLNQRISLTPLRKLWLAWKTYVRG